MIRECFFSQTIGDGIVFNINSVKTADVHIWQEVFKDELSEINSAVRKLENCSFCASLTQNNTVLSQYIGIKTNIKGKKGIYIYALCTNPLYRNKGYMKRLLELSFEYAKNAGYDFFWLFPASENLKKSYNKLGFTVEIPVGASPFPLEENDFYNEFNFDHCDKSVSFSLFDGNYKQLYSFSDMTFDYDAFEYSLAGISSLIEIKYIKEGGNVTGYIVFSKAFPEKVLCVSDRYSHLIKTEKKEFAYLYPISLKDYTDIYSIEPLPR